MTGKTAILTVAVVMSLVFVLGTVSAHDRIRANDRLQIHDELESVLETGTYEDLVDLREKYDRVFMQWVQSEEDFELATEMHERMEQYMGEGGFMMGATGGFRGAGCPMHGGF